MLNLKVKQNRKFFQRSVQEFQLWNEGELEEWREKAEAKDRGVFRFRDDKPFFKVNQTQLTFLIFWK